MAVERRHGLPRHGLPRRALVRGLALGLGSAAVLGTASPLLRAQGVGETAPLAALQGAEREQKLLDGARREGQLNLYTSLTVEDMAVLNAAFEKRYAVKVRMWRAGSDKVLQRVVTEARAGRFEVDVVETNALPLESLHREKLLQPVHSPLAGTLIAGAVPAHGAWVASRLNVFVQAYNTQRVAAAEVPKTFDDLLDARWRGRLGIEASDDDWFSVVVKQRGEAAGLRFFRDLVKTNGLSVRKGHTLLTQMVASGEISYALTVYNFTTEQLRSKGAPIAWHVLAPAVARANGVAVPRRVAHPHAAVLYHDFMLGEEAQKILSERDFVPTARAARSPLAGTPITLVDASQLLDDGDKWTRLYDEIVVRQSS
jgi:iron(III) transport system substrate-binding protein